MPVRTYDPKKVKVVIGGIPMGGFADGTFVTIERSNDSFTKVSGADGPVSRAKSNDFSGMLTLTLAQTSPSNDVLSGFLLADELEGEGIIPVIVKDFGGSSNLVSAFGWVRKPANASYAKEIEDREWTLDLADLDMFVGSNPNAE